MPAMAAAADIHPRGTRLQLQAAEQESGAPAFPQAVADAALRAMVAKGSPEDRKTAFDAWRSRAEQGDAQAAWLLAEAGLDDPNADHQAILTALRQAVEAGIPAAMHRYGQRLLQGLNGTAPDRQGALVWCRRAAEAGHGPAQLDLALMTAEGHDQDSAVATRWLLCAAANEVPAATTCIEVLERPRAWDAAETRLSVVLNQSDVHKPMRLAEFYCDPCLDLLTKRLRINQDQAEDIVQQFFLELEEPLAKGGYSGRPWKEALRASYNPQQGDFRPYLRRVLERFAMDWFRQQPGEIVPRPEEGDPATFAEVHGEEWSRMLASFTDDHAHRPAPVPRSCNLLVAALVDDLDQATLAKHYRVTDRTVRSGLRLAAELLKDWLRSKLAGTLIDQARRGRLDQAVDAIPGWLRHLSTDKRLKALAIIALVGSVSGSVPVIVTRERPAST